MDKKASSFFKGFNKKNEEIFEGKEFIHPINIGNMKGEQYFSKIFKQK